MTGAARFIVIVGVVLLVVGMGASAIYFSEINQQMNVMIVTLEAEVDQLEEWNSYQSTQIGAQQLTLGALSTSDPAGNADQSPMTVTLTPYDRIFGVLIEEGRCCVGGIAGETVNVRVQFFPRMNELPGAVVEMRVITGAQSVSQVDLDAQPWEPYFEEKTYPVHLVINWTTFWVHAQFRTAAGDISEIYSDEVAVEGMPGSTVTP